MNFEVRPAIRAAAFRVTAATARGEAPGASTARVEWLAFPGEQLSGVRAAGTLRVSNDRGGVLRLRVVDAAAAAE